MMLRGLTCLCVLLFCADVSGQQLTWREAQTPLPIRTPRLLSSLPGGPLTAAPLRSAPSRTTIAPVFDFTATRPHLAFFCRLEINEKAGNVIPAKFRLGGHTYWQDEPAKRD